MIKQFIKRFKLWLKPNKNCSRCCLTCKYYDICNIELTEEEQQYARELDA